MSDKNFKDIRKQLRNIAKELMPEILRQEMVLNAMKEVQAHITRISNHINSRLDAVDEKQKEFHSYIVRQLAAVSHPVEKPKTEVKNEENL